MTVQQFKERYPCYGGNGLRGYVDTLNAEGNFLLIRRQGALYGNIKIWQQVSSMRLNTPLQNKRREVRMDNQHCDSNNFEKYKQKVKKYLELENVSILAGAGTSFHLGAPTIREIPDELKKQCENEIAEYFSENTSPSFEDLVNCLQADRFVKINKGGSVDSIDESILKMQKWLFEKCDIRMSEFPNQYKCDVKLAANRYYYHEMLIKKLLQRPNNLKRANLFTTNYDMAFDYGLDNMGIHYINGFLGVHNRVFRPEVYEYDLYYPGESVTGKVYRAEKVLKYYKLHGSLSWIFTEPSECSTYGIQEIPLNSDFTSDEKGLVVYPCVSKKTFALDLPYSELFRQFSQAINKPQSVLICLGYSFFDEHINDIIKQALSIPSFTLIIANYAPPTNDSAPTPGDDSEIAKMQKLGDKRIIVLDEKNKDISTFAGFVENVMPDLYEEEENAIIAQTMRKLYADSYHQ